MGLLDGILGNASKVDVGEATQEYSRLLGEGERIRVAYLLIRDVVLFTDRRLITINKQGLSGRKVAYHTIPYRNIVHFVVETAGTFDLDAELRIYLSGRPEPIQQQFSKGVNVYEVQALLTAYVAR